MNKTNQLFEDTLITAGDQLTLQYYDTKPEKIYELINYADAPLLKAKIIAFIESSFDKLREVALDHKIKQDKIWNDGYEESVMVNHIAFGTLARLVGILGAKELAPLLYNEFIGLKRSFHGLSLERGTIAISLSLLDFQGEIKEIQDIIDDAVSNEYSINEREHILKMFYSFCILKKDKTRALDYLNNDKRTKNMSFVAAAVADLDVKEALAILRKRFDQLDNPITKEVFIEAIHRLETQTDVPNVADRMILMFGKRSDTELALGNESDNIFVLRAIEKTGDEELGMFY